MSREVIFSALRWIHVGAGALWIGAAACFAIASAALDDDSAEQRDFASRGGATLARIAALGALVVVAAGVANLAAVLNARGGDLSRAFVEIVVAKVTIFIVMAVVLGVAMRAGSAARTILARDANASIAALMRLTTRTHLACALMSGAE